MRKAIEKLEIIQFYHTPFYRKQLTTDTKKPAKYMHGLSQFYSY